VSAREVNGATPSCVKEHDEGLACWLEAVRRRRVQLEVDIRAGERAQLVLCQLANVRRRMSGVAEDLYEQACAALERASSELAKYDRQSQGALAESNERVREASRRLFSARTAGKDTPEKPDSEVRRLEQEHKDAHAADRRLLRERTGRRVPLERRHAAASRDILLAGQALLASLESDRPRLAAAAAGAERARTELQEIERVEKLAGNGASPSDRGTYAAAAGGNTVIIDALKAADVYALVSEPIPFRRMTDLAL
jgi:hypothetical protein